MKTKTFSIHDGSYNIRCLLYSGDDAPRRVVIYCHGFAGSKETRTAGRFAEYMFPKYKDMAVLCFDLPCHGEDVRKKLCLSDCAGYFGTVIRYAKETLHAEEIYGYASSFGGYLLLKYAAENGNPFRFIALRSPAVNMYEVMYSLMPENDRALLAKGKDAPVGFEKKIAVSAAFLEELKQADVASWDFRSISDSVLIIHGDKDEVVPFAAVEAFASRNGIDFIPLQKGDHLFSNPKLMTEAIQYIEAFFEC